MENMKTIAFYISNIIYRVGGTESYTANMLEVLQKIHPEYRYMIITERYPHTQGLNEADLASKLNSIYGLHIASENICIKYICAPDHKNRWQYLYFYHKIRSITKHVDLFIYCSRGLYSSCAKKNIAVIHFPTEPKEKKSFSKNYPLLRWFAYKTDRSYLQTYDLFLPNSHFTAYWLKKWWNISDDKIKIVYPPVTPIPVPAHTIKEKTILICSRIEQSKRIEYLIQAFLNSHYLSTHFTLIIAGSTQQEDSAYIDSIKNQPDCVQFIFNPDRAVIQQLYIAATFFWHAKGFGIEESENPYQMEHFGITTVEAMSAGCIPVVINKGGQKEIVTENVGYTWDTLEQLIRYTEDAAQNSQKLQTLSQNAQIQSRQFLKSSFSEQLKCLIDTLHL